MKLENQKSIDQPSDWIPELHDIPIGLVNKFLYYEHTEAKKNANKRVFYE